MESYEIQWSTAIMILFPLVIVAGLIAGLIILQIYLSKKENKWLGLIWPLITFFFALFFSLMFIFNIQTVNVQTVPEISIVSVVLQMFLIFILYNIPTAILLLIYFACRKKLIKAHQLTKMKIQDLE